MNGMITVEIGGVKINLIFGMLAIEEFSKSQAIGSNGLAKMSADLVYAGYCNAEIIARRSPSLSYGDVSALVDDEIINRGPAIEEVFKCFEASKAGQSLLPTIEKKKESGPVKRTPTKKRTGTK